MALHDYRVIVLFIILYQCYMVYLTEFSSSANSTYILDSQKTGLLNATLCHGIKHIVVEKAYAIGETIDLTFMDKCLDLETFWLKNKIQLNKCNDIKSQIVLPNKGSLQYRKLREVRINTGDFTGLAFCPDFICHAPSLEILDLSGSNSLGNWNNYKFFSRFNASSLKWLSLRQCLRKINALETIRNALNINVFFAAIKNNQIEHLDLSDNNLNYISGSFSIIFSKLKYIDLSNNMLLTGKGLVSLLILHPSIENIEYDMPTVPHPSLPSYKTCRESNQEHIPMYHKKDKKENLLSPILGSPFGLFGSCVRNYNTTIQQVMANSSLYCQTMRCLGHHALDDIPCEEINQKLSLANIAHYFDGTCHKGFKLPVSEHLKYLNVRAGLAIANEYQENPKICFAKNSLENLTLGLKGVGDAITQLFLENVIITGLDKLKVLNIVNSSVLLNLTQLSLWESVNQLRELRLPGNFIIIDNKTLQEMFPSLEILDVSNNNMNSLPFNFIKNARKIKKIILNNNQFGVLNLNFGSVPNLEVVDLVNNKIHYISKKTIESLIGSSRLMNLSFKFENNVIGCGCMAENIETIRFIKNAYKYNITFSSYNRLTCTRGGHYYNIDQIDLDKMQSECFPSNVKMIITISVINFCVAIFFIGIFICYRYRFRIYTTWIHFKLKTFRKSSEETNYKFDAFISYCTEDRFWVHNTLMKKLEAFYGFKLCIYDRDFIVGNDIADEIVINMKKSRYIISILSDCSINRPWVQYELKQAHHQFVNEAKNFFIIKLGEIKQIPESSLTKQLLDCKIYMEWPELNYTPGLGHNVNTSQQVESVQNAFWAKLANKLYVYTRIEQGGNDDETMLQAWPETYTSI